MAAEQGRRRRQLRLRPETAVVAVAVGGGPVTGSHPWARASWAKAPPQGKKEIILRGEQGAAQVRGSKVRAAHSEKKKERILKFSF